MVEDIFLKDVALPKVPGFNIRKSGIRNGAYRLTFEDPIKNKSGGGVIDVIFTKENGSVFNSSWFFFTDENGRSYDGNGVVVE